MHVQLLLLLLYRLNTGNLHDGNRLAHLSLWLNIIRDATWGMHNACSPSLTKLTNSSVRMTACAVYTSILDRVLWLLIDHVNVSVPTSDSDSESV